MDSINHLISFIHSSYFLYMQKTPALSMPLSFKMMTFTYFPVLERPGRNIQIAPLGSCKPTISMC